ncbi:MAG: endoribonuclease MazF [Proteobacteria bacterium]|nr:endoribonuclease MazF [Pseudomonadota bacterium]
MVTYVPDRGDIVWIEFDPQKGHEIKKKRPALIISPKSYNQKTSLALVMPITSQIKGYPFEVLVDSKEVEGVVLADHMRSVDWRMRNAQKITTVSKKVVHEALSKLALLVGWD